MDEIINPDEHSAQIAALEHEIYRLNRVIDEKTEDALKRTTANADDPFENPTDYKGFCGSYSKMQPLLGELGYKLPLEPDAVERKNLRKNYSIGSWCMILQFVFSLAVSLFLIQGLMFILTFLYPNSNGESVYSYMYGSSILIAVNMLVYLICNVLFTHFGLKWAGFKGTDMIQTKNYSFGKAVQYCLIAIFLWTVSVYMGAFVETIMNKFDLSCVSDQSGLGDSPMGLAIETLYSCIIAPITEEMLFRGMLLKVFSKADQKFAIIASAFFFGLAHGNIPQFILAFLLGIFLSHITMRHNSIIPAIIVHIFINSFSTVFGMFEDQSSMIVSIATIVMFALSIIGLVMLIVFKGDGDGKLPTPTPYQKRRGLSVALSSLPFCIAISIECLHMLYNMFT